MYLRKPRRMGDGYGDIILAPSIQNRKIKKWMIGVSVAILLVVVLFIILWLTGVIGEDKESRRAREIAEFHEFLREPRDQIIDASTLVGYYYSESASISNFILSLEDYEGTKQVLENGVSAMEKVSERLKNGPRLVGAIVGINLAENYDGLNIAIDESLDKYRAFVDLTLKFCRIFLEYKDTTVAELLAGYSDEAIAFGETMRELFVARDAAGIAVNSSCSDYNSVECQGALEIFYDLWDQIRAKNLAILTIYRDNIGDIKYSGDGSVTYYVNNLSVATGASDEE